MGSSRETGEGEEEGTIRVKQHPRKRGSSEKGRTCKVGLDGNFKEPFRASRVFEIFPLKELQASVDSSADSARGQQRRKRRKLRARRARSINELIKIPSKPGSQSSFFDDDAPLCLSKALFRVAVHRSREE